MEVRSRYKQTEVGVIPEDWDVVLLDTVQNEAADTHLTRRILSIGRGESSGSPFKTLTGSIDSISGTRPPRSLQQVSLIHLRGCTRKEQSSCREMQASARAPS